MTTVWEILWAIITLKIHNHPRGDRHERVEHQPFLVVIGSLLCYIEVSFGFFSEFRVLYEAKTVHSFSVLFAILHFQPSFRWILFGITN